MSRLFDWNRSTRKILAMQVEAMEEEDFDMCLLDRIGVASLEMHVFIV